jgi:hypothetical protein
MNLLRKQTMNCSIYSIIIDALKRVKRAPYMTTHRNVRHKARTSTGETRLKHTNPIKTKQCGLQNEPQPENPRRKCQGLTV